MLYFMLAFVFMVNTLSGTYRCEDKGTGRVVFDAKGWPSTVAADGASTRCILMIENKETI